MQKFFTLGQHNWYKLQTLGTRSFYCGFCGDKVSSEKGYKIGEKSDGSGPLRGAIHICPNCQGPTFFTLEDMQIPSSAIGNSVSNVPSDINSLYEEARRCTTDNCHTAAVLLCRKLLMNIAVNQGGGEGKRFIEYVNYLSDEGYVPPNGKHWVDHIRKKGNEANHEIQLMSEDDARDLLVFIEMLLKFIYEFPSMVPANAGS
jgi:hypothetical protein